MIKILACFVLFFAFVSTNKPVWGDVLDVCPEDKPGARCESLAKSYDPNEYELVDIFNSCKSCETNGGSFGSTSMCTVELNDDSGLEELKCEDNFTCTKDPCHECEVKAPDGTKCCCQNERFNDGSSCSKKVDYVFYKSQYKGCRMGIGNHHGWRYGCCPVGKVYTPNDPNLPEGLEMCCGDGEVYEGGTKCCEGVVYRSGPNAVEECCTTTLKQCADGTSKCGGTCCPDGEVEYTSENDKIGCCLETRLYRDDNGQQACCASDLKEVNGEKVCMGCKKDEIPYVNEDGKEDCCAGKTYNCNDEDNDGIETCDCCPKCTEDTDGDGVFDAPDGCGDVKNK